MVLPSTPTFKAVSRFLAAVTAVVFLSAGIMPHLARAAATINLSAPVANGGNYGITVSLDTGGAASSGATIYLNLPGGVAYVSNDATSSVFTTEVTPPTTSGNSVHFARVTLNPSGYTGSNGNVLDLVFSGALSLVQQITVDTGTSQVLDTNGNPITLASATPTPSASSSATPAPSSTATATPTATPTATATATASAAATASPVATPSSLAETGADSTFPIAVASIGIVGISLFQLRRRGQA